MSNARHVHADVLRPKLIALSVAAWLGVYATHTAANPTGATVVSGTAPSVTSGKTLTITNSANAIINWQSFSIGAGEITRFVQPSASSAVLNRVVGANSPSLIDGTLQSVLASGSVAGRVFLINPSGVVIGATGIIDVAGFVASSLNLSDADFLAGRMRFTETPGAGGVSNAGLIDTSNAGPGGRVLLVGPDVQNSGVIRSPQGEIILAAGKSVELVSEGTPFVTVNITADSEQALNVGQLLADSGRVGMFGALVRQGGVAEANSAVVGANGEIRLVATNSVTLDTGSITSASGGAQGGNVQVSAPVVVQAGDIRADGSAGGKIQIDSTNFLQAGTLSASGSAGAGGEIGVNAPHVIQTSAAVIAADGVGGDGGSISVDASGAADGLLFSSARYSATGDKGGSIKLLGHDIVLLGASADASGANGGGTILVGGDFHGSNPAVPNAATTGVNFSTTLKADATQNGDGGKIVVWSDSNTQFYGTASARGGAQSGNGGSMEISSGGDHLAMFGFADAGAPKGTPGTLTLDPKNIIIDSAAGTGTLGSFQLLDPNPVAGNGFGSQVVVLPNAAQNVVVTAPNDNFGATGAGAVFLYNSSTGALISALTGSSVNDHVGSRGITVLPSSGNFVINSSTWNNGTIATSAGAVTFGNGTTGVNGTVSAANSLVGSTTNDQIGSDGVLPLSNGNYVVISPNWSNGVNALQAGAVTLGNGASGIVGQVSSANSLVGSSLNDKVGSFGVTPLTGGAYVVLSPDWNNGAAAQVGAVTFVNASTNVSGAVSAGNSLVGRTAGDRVGSGFVTELSNGNYLVFSPSWSGTAGAVTLMNGTDGTTVTGGALGTTVSATNSLVGSVAGDAVGSSGAEQLTNGNYVVLSPNWTNPLGVPKVGAVTFGAPTNLPVGPVSSTNSLVGSTANDQVGQFPITELTNGNFLIFSPNWNINSVATLAGAVTFANGLTGVVGVVSSANSLVGGTAGDQVGIGGVIALTNGNYVVGSPNWDQVGAAPIVDVGAATFGNGTTGVSGTISAANSLIGSKPGDRVGFSVTGLSSGNYVVASPLWGNGAATQAGAVTLGNGATGTIGTVSTANSLVGSATGDQVGFVIREVGNGNFVVSSPNWSNGAALQAGAATFVNGTTGLTGPVSSGNSLVGSTAGDQVGNSVASLSNGNYVVLSPNWTNTGAAGAGAVTFGSGTTGIAGAVSATNSLVGSTTNDHVGSSFVTELTNGNYVVNSPDWNNGAAALAGAVTLVNGTNGNIVATGTPGGVVSSANSLVGTTANDQVGFGNIMPLVLSGNYVVSSPNWNGGMGAATFGNGTTGVVGAVSAGNSLVGSTADNATAGTTGDHVGSFSSGGGILQLSSGTYLVSSPQWNNGTASRAGAVTWVSDTNGNVFGQTSPGAVVSASNSLVGGTINDQVGTLSCECNSGIHFLPNGNFALVTGTWTNPATSAASAGAVTFIPATGIAGLITPANSIVGTAAGDSLGSGGIFPLINGNFVVSSPFASGGAGLVHVVTPGTAGSGAPATGQTFSANPSGDVTITPSAITAITNGGTALVLQANNDITLKPGSDIITSAGGLGGSLTMQAGRSILLNSSVTTDNGNLTLTANETGPSGVDPLNRDPGAAVITQAAGTTLNAGSGSITITITDGLGRIGTQADTGAISLANVTTSGNLTVTNAGLTAGSDVLASGTLRGAALVKMTATGALGSAIAPLQVATANLSAGATTGIHIDTNLASPAPVTVLNLTNTISGDIVLNAHGGATTNTLVSNPGGNVTINSFSPLDIGAGITAGNSIFLSTGGTPSGPTNDMSLAGLYTYNVSTGAFEVTVGVGGALTLFTGSTPLVLTAPLFPNPVNITRFTFVQETADQLGLDANAVIQGINQLILTNNAPSADDLQKKNAENKKKKEAVACK